MLAKELQAIQDEINFDAPSMAACLKISYEQYRRYYYDHAKIPSSLEQAVLELRQTNIEFRESAPARIDADIFKHCPNGFLSDPFDE